MQCFRSCLQIQKVVIALGDYMNALCHACIGGTNVREDMNKLASGMHVVVGTPGRVLDMINRGALSKRANYLFVLKFIYVNSDVYFRNEVHQAIRP